MARTPEQNNAIITGNIPRQLLLFFFPIWLGTMFQQLYNTVDTLIVGNFVGTQALAAVGATSSFVQLLVGLFVGLCSGAGVIIAQSFGAGDHDEVNRQVHTALALAIAGGAALTVIGLLISRPVLRLMQTPDEIVGMASEYLQIYFLGMIPQMIYNMGTNILRAVGDSRRPLYFLCFSAVINTVLDLLFVIRFRMGVAGVAYATILSQFLSALLVLFVLTHDHTPYGIRWRELRIRRDTLSHILSIGLPSGVQQAITSFSNVFVQSYINFFGSACMAGWSSYNKLDVFILIPLQSIALASTTFVGQNFGAGKTVRARSGARQALVMSLIITAALSVLLMLCARPLLSLFTPDPEVIEYGARFIILISPFYITTCFNQIFAGALRGVGNAKVPMVIMLLSFVVFRQLYLYIVRLLGNSFFFVAIAYPMGWILCSALLTVCYKRSALCRAGCASPAE